MVPAISLHQVWATAFARGLKRNETRGDIPIFRNRYRGPIAIHAAKKPFRPGDYADEFICFCVKHGLLENLIYGAVLCIADLIDKKKTEEFDAAQLSYSERMLGNYGPKRLVLITENLRVLPEPHYCRGSQGWFGWTVPQQYEYLIKGEFKLR